MRVKLKGLSTKWTNCLLVHFGMENMIMVSKMSNSPILSPFLHFLNSPPDLVLGWSDLLLGRTDLVLGR